jgi:osmotically-inducible protein OsmY
MATAIRTDEEIQRDVLEELAWDARVRPNEIGVIVEDGVVTLTGWCVHQEMGGGGGGPLGARGEGTR